MIKKGKRINLSENVQRIEKEKPQKAEKNLKRKKYEEEIIRILLNYGDKKITFDNDTVLVYDFIINELEADNITINNEPHNKIYSEIKRLSSLNKFNQSYFTSHRENAINKLSIDLLSNKHIISENWASRHKIYTSVESENLKKTAEKSILMLKAQHVEEEVALIQAKIKSNSAKHEDITLLNNLIKIKNKISNLVGRTGF